MNTKLKSGAEKRRLKEQQMLLKAGSDPKQKKIIFSKVITNDNSNVSFSNENKVTNGIISSESKVNLIRYSGV